MFHREALKDYGTYHLNKARGGHDWLSLDDMVAELWVGLRIHPKLGIVQWAVAQLALPNDLGGLNMPRNVLGCKGILWQSARKLARAAVKSIEVDTIVASGDDLSQRSQELEGLGPRLK